MSNNVAIIITTLHIPDKAIWFKVDRVCAVIVTRSLINIVVYHKYIIICIIDDLCPVAELNDRTHHTIIYSGSVGIKPIVSILAVGLVNYWTLSNEMKS